MVEPQVGMLVRSQGPYWTNRPRSEVRYQAVIIEVSSDIVILDSNEKGQSQRWSRGAFWTMWEELPTRFTRELDI